MTAYKTDIEINDLVTAFERGTIGRDQWKHAEHMIVALYYIERYDLETATNKMRKGILNLLKAFEVDLAKEMPYHETLTVFWMRTIAGFNASKNGESTVAKVRDMVDVFDKEYAMRFYTRELLFSDRARAKFVEPDLASISLPPERLP